MGSLLSHIAIKIPTFGPDVGHIAQLVEHQTQLYRFWSGSILIVITNICTHASHENADA
jgi:hypothetical protein